MANLWQILRKRRRCLSFRHSRQAESAGQEGLVGQIHPVHNGVPQTAQYAPSWMIPMHSAWNRRRRKVMTREADHE
ncbi:hypothetical protein [Methylicorpusculum sp.]|uniref:hypothetical protein n=1 Tax=Methylicorpusculum sp. TaxID=2713644 RepID=UPI002AB92599|nr:hypothetical protein [Methylicorpusculum sp.]MDZ4149569.1 hypothetical protein [Methylicorpusculum sp.]